MVPETVMMMKIFPAPSSRVNHSWWDLSLARPDTSTQHLTQYTHYTYSIHYTWYSWWDLSLARPDTSTQHLTQYIVQYTWYSWWDLSLARPDTSTQHLTQFIVQYTTHTVHST